jgi:signal transduction histidine kinase
MELGADDYLAKPFSVPELVSAVEARYKKFQAYRQMAEKRVDELCSSISLSLPHELLTPLTGILGIGQVLRDSGQNMSSDQVVELSQLIIDSGNRLHRMINNFLIFTQIELLMAKPNEIDQQAKKITQNTKTLIFETAMSYALSAGRNNDLKLDLHASSAAISEDFLVKIVQELLDNAFKFSKTASTVTLSTRVVDNSFVLSVTDQGIGMPSERISQIGAFMQFDRKILEQQGSGLGLAIIKRFLEIHKGSIEIESVLGQGTTVRIWLAQNMG